ncbi:unnamed protein product [Brachionus calyciflorus]|uniref:Uncharacterized protein n=1 Tax=Brachionus calyciflorus TaxID=104777 RepID=A0A813RQR3_9BILA|nr:unnamed protein product [Brachionus calyciflorus]
MFKIDLKLVLALVLCFVSIYGLETNSSQVKNWLNTCNLAKCQVAISQCKTCSGVSGCKACIINYDPICQTCANDIFDTRYMISANGQNYLPCDQFDSFQINTCQVYCRANGKSYGECKTVQTFTGCLCYNQFNGNFYKTLTGFSPIYSVASSSNYNEFAVGFQNGSISVFDYYGNYRRTFNTFLSQVNSIAYFSNGDIAVTGNSGSRLFSNGGAEKMFYTSNWGYAVTVLKNGEVAYSHSNYIYVRSPTSSSNRLAINAHVNTICSLLGLPNGDLVSGSADNTIKIWNMVDGSLKRTLLGHTSSVLSLIILENGDLASGSVDRTIRIWNTNIGLSLKTISTDHRDYIRSLALLPNGHIASASDDKTIKIYDRQYGNLIKTLEGHSNYVMGLALTNGYLASVSLDYSSLASYILECIKNLPERSANTRFRSFADDLNKLKNYFEKDRCVTKNNKVTGKTQGKTIGEEYESESVSFNAYVSYVFSIAYFSNGDIAVTGNSGSRLFSNSGAEKISYTLNWGYAVTVLKNGEVAYAHSNYINVRSPTSSSNRLAINAHVDTIFILLVHPNGDLVSGSQDNTIEIWNMVDGSLKRTLLGHTSSVLSLIILENGDLASGSVDRTIRIWNTNIGLSLKTISTDHRDYIRSLALLPNGHIASASDDKTIKIYDRQYGNLIKTLEGHSNYVMGLALTNGYLASVSLDVTVRLWT